MRRPLNWLVVLLSLGFLAVGGRLGAPVPAPAPDVVVPIVRTPIQPAAATAVPAALRRHAELEFGYIELER